MDSSEYSVVDEFDTLIEDSTLYYSMAENDETFDEKNTENMQTFVKRRPSDGTPTQVANKTIMQRLSLSSTPIQAIRAAKYKEWVDFMKENEEYKKNENLPDDEKRKSWDCLGNKDEMVKIVNKFTDEKADKCTSSEEDEDDKTIENESLINNVLVNTTEDTATFNDDRENMPDINVQPLETKEKKNRRESQIPMGIKRKSIPRIHIECPNCLPHDNPIGETPVKLRRILTPGASDFEFSQNLPEILGSIKKLMRIAIRRCFSAKKLKTPSGARITIYSPALRRVSLAGPSTSRKSFLSPNIIAASGRRKRYSVAKPAATVASKTCKYCFKQFKIAKAFSNHLLENCLKIPPAERRRLAIENMKKIKASKNFPSSPISPSSTSENVSQPTKPHARCHSCKEYYPTVYQFAEDLAHHSKR